jgi:predicted dehydrogenase
MSLMGVRGNGTVALKVGVVGCGYWGSKHLRVLQGVPEVGQVIAIDASEERLQDLRQGFPGLVTFRSLSEALDRIDAVVIATPPATHVGLALTAIEAGKGVLVEKPLATSVADARLLIDAASARSVTLMVGHTFEHNAAVWKLKELIETGELGRIYYLDSARLNLGLYQWDVNVIWDLAPHDISIFNHILGAKPAFVEAWGSRHAHEYLEDVAFLRLQYPELGVSANIHVSWLDPCKVRRVTVVGSGKMAVYNDLSAEERIRIFDRGVEAPGKITNVQDIPMSYRYGDVRSPYIAFQEPLSVQDRQFVACVIGGFRSTTDGENGLAVVEVLEAADISLREGRPVRLDELSQPADVGLVAVS